MRCYAAQLRARVTKICREGRYFLLVFALGILVRSIPNLITQFPTGYDTVYYATQILDWRNSLADPNIVFQTPLHLLILGPIYGITGLDPFTILKVAQPLLYGLLSIAFYYASRRLLNWEPKQAFLATIIFSLQTTTLRISFDLLRNELGLVLLLFILPTFKNFKKRQVMFTLLSTLVILSHQTTSIILFIIIVYYLFTYIRKGEYCEARRLLLYSLPAALLFGAVIVNTVGLLNIPFTPAPSIFTNIISIPEKNNIFFNYLAGEDFVNYNQSYINLLTDVLSLYLASFILILPLVVKGTRSLKEKSIGVWTGFCAFGAFMCLITPSFAILLWHRWMQLLIVPYAFYATNGIYMISRNWKTRISRKKLVIMTCTIYAIVAILYMTTPYTNPISPYAAISPSSKYSPTTMLRNTVPIEDTPDVKQALLWLNQNMGNDTCLLTRDAFLNWAKLYLDKGNTIIYYRFKDVSAGLKLAETFNYSRIYWIWWAENGVGLSRYGQSVPNDFLPIYTTGNIVVYKHA
ncbi:hypothetical protein MUP05_05735 [Candidatus Bathyarchaeota archaeon]|nr:hypothetical protein [Candidatus Bathyarchaeota archaeon]